MDCADVHVEEGGVYTEGADVQVRDRVDLFRVRSLMDVEQPQGAPASSQALRLILHRTGNNDEPPMLLQVLSLALEIRQVPPAEQVRLAMQFAVDRMVPPDTASSFVVVLEQLLARHVGLFDFLLPSDEGGATFLDVLFNLLHRADLEENPKKQFIAPVLDSAMVLFRDVRQQASLRRIALCTVVLTWLRMRKLLLLPTEPVVRDGGIFANRCIETSLGILRYVRGG